ncbi:MAG TPA: guanitoxin biosynthesis L-enduracididine beta-hydroxylase GntD [Thermoanaerobaculia bacterium]|nr:guanitoxin biosynthesis L-enduracididine beta-hydroxylase GntD [Thermoanaerobaculia bacterium]
MSRIILQPEDVAAVRRLGREVAAGIDSVEDETFLRDAPLWAHELPRALRRELNEFKLREPASGYCIVSGYTVDQAKIGPTPAHWKHKKGRSGALEEEVLLVLLGSLLGDCIGWATQQDGTVVHDILPIQGHQGEQLGSGSEQLLWWHTEDAFHPYRGDYLGMMCLRNPDAVATTYASLEGLALAEEHLDLLFSPHYTIRPDESHLRKNRANPAAAEGQLGASYDQIERMSTRPEKIAVLHGDQRAPYIRIDPYFMDLVEDNPPAQAALDALIAFIESRLEELAFEPGELCFIDNFKAVHGRQPFKARFDGTDRWLKRVNIARDLRKSRTARARADSRIIQ